MNKKQYVKPEKEFKPKSMEHIYDPIVHSIEDIAEDLYEHSSDIIYDLKPGEEIEIRITISEKNRSVSYDVYKLAQGLDV